MHVYHRTPNADAILAEGFRDSEDFYMTSQTFRGVWVSDRSLDINEGADGDMLLTLEIPEEVFIEYEWTEEGKGYREALIPSALLNQYGPPRVSPDE